MSHNSDKAADADDRAQKQLLSRYTLAALILSEPVLETLCRELRRLSPDVQVDTAQIRRTLKSEVLKRKVTQSDEAAQAQQMIERDAAEHFRVAKPQEGDKLKEADKPKGADRPKEAESADAVSAVGIKDPVIDAVENVDGMSG